MYEFQGIFTRQCCSTLGLNPSQYTLRDLRPSYPFWGVRVHPQLNDVGDNTACLEEAVLQMIEAGLSSGFALNYVTFGGPVEYLAGFEIENSVIATESRFESSDLCDGELMGFFIAKMRGYGIPPETNGFFFPLERGFWGE